MKKALAIAAAALMLAGCGADIEPKKDDTSAVVTDKQTTGDEDKADKIVVEVQEKPAETTAPEKDESKPETKAPAKKKADPDKINVGCMDTVEVYQRIRLKDFVFDSNAKLKNGDEYLKTDETGEQEVTLRMELDGGEAEKKVKYNVVDTTPPVMLLGDDISLSVGDDFNIDDYVSYADNLDRAPVLTVEGDVDTSAEGSYPLTLYIDDASGNRLTRYINVNVGVPSSSSDDETYDDSAIEFGDFVENYSADGREFGIDVSRWQGDIDFDAVAEAGCKFVIIRMGYGESGGTDLDEYYYNNIEGATEAGLKVGVYFYSTDTTIEGARATAKKIVKTLDGHKLDFPVAFDWEEFQSFQRYGMSIHDLSEVYEAFASELEKNGYAAMLYSSKNFLELFWENKNDRPIWVAHYVEETTYEGDWYIWQRCGTGRIDGINGAVDLNVLQGE
ncbi:GH25 family lysozyme [Ruminococcus albus]|uniref:Lyzozyme M1 (1,4-beta-N-acetylmuramidase), GH25 family n=1 Tax=Ruminococcus albus TaxID=1264 RepID=A0A1I1LJ59_RUMAL|nr:GH25 family lysozyme [Ruminococcus albus]SFC73134.1 Lyzozyme M1 (1,4-beta-N-acetylmuramidase), GH25 family [Ruminococcus albus]